MIVNPEDILWRAVEEHISVDGENVPYSIQCIHKKYGRLGYISRATVNTWEDPRKCYSIFPFFGLLADNINIAKNLEYLVSNLHYLENAKAGLIYIAAYMDMEGPRLDELNYYYDNKYN